MPSIEDVKNGYTPQNEEIECCLPIEIGTQTDKIVLKYDEHAFDLKWDLDEKTSNFFLRAGKLMLDELAFSESMDVFQSILIIIYR